VLSEDCFGLLALELGDLDLAHRVLVILLQLKVVIALVHKFDWVLLLVLEFNDDSLLTLDVILKFVNLLLGLLDVKQLLLLGLLSGLHLSVDLSGFPFLSGELVLQLLQASDGGGRVDFEDKKLVIAIVNILDMFLILNL